MADLGAVQHHEGMFPPELIVAVDHVGIAVPDLDEAVAFYRESFGFRLVHEEVNDEMGVREAMLAVGDGDTRLQLLAPLNADSSIAGFLDRKGPGIQQLAYRVTSIDDAMAAVREQGMRLLYDEPRRGTGRQPDQLHPPQGRRRGAGRARRARLARRSRCGRWLDEVAVRSGSSRPQDRRRRRLPVHIDESYHGSSGSVVRRRLEPQGLDVRPEHRAAPNRQGLDVPPDGSAIGGSVASPRGWGPGAGKFMEPSARHTPRLTQDLPHLR